MMRNAYPADAENVMALIAAIVTQAVEDYRKSYLKCTKADGDHKKDAAMKRECERFFHSPWCEMLTGIDKNVMLYNLRKMPERKRLYRNHVQHNTRTFGRA